MRQSRFSCSILPKNNLNPEVHSKTYSQFSLKHWNHHNFLRDFNLRFHQTMQSNTLQFHGAGILAGKSHALSFFFCGWSNFLFRRKLHRLEIVYPRFQHDVLWLGIEFLSYSRSFCEQKHCIHVHCILIKTIRFIKCPFLFRAVKLCNKTNNTTKTGATCTFFF